MHIALSNAQFQAFDLLTRFWSNILQVNFHRLIPPLAFQIAVHHWADRCKDAARKQHKDYNWHFCFTNASRHRDSNVDEQQYSRSWIHWTRQHFAAKCKTKFPCPAFATNVHLRQFGNLTRQGFPTTSHQVQPSKQLKLYPSSAAEHLHAGSFVPRAKPQLWSVKWDRIKQLGDWCEDQRGRAGQFDFSNKDFFAAIHTIGSKLSGQILITSFHKNEKMKAKMNKKVRSETDTPVSNLSS